MHPRTDWRLSIALLVLWVLWLSLSSTWNLPTWALLPMTSVVLLFGAFAWDLLSGAFVILAMSWLHHVFSITPPGLYWLSLYAVFVLLKLATSQLALQGAIHIFLLLFGASFFQEVFQLWLMSRSYDDLFLKWSILGPIFGSALFQAILGLLFTQPLLRRSQMHT